MKFEMIFTWFRLAPAKLADFISTTLITAETSWAIDALLTLKSEFAAELFVTTVFVFGALGLE